MCYVDVKHQHFIPLPSQTSPIRLITHTGKTKSLIRTIPNWWNRGTGDALLVTVCTVAQHCCKGDKRFQWEMPFFRVFQLRNPWTDFQKILHSWLRRWPHPTRKYLDQSVQRGCVCACVKLSSSGVYFLGFFRFFLDSCSSLQVCPFDR